MLFISAGGCSTAVSEAAWLGTPVPGIKRHAGCWASALQLDELLPLAHRGGLLPQTQPSAAARRGDMHDVLFRDQRAAGVLPLAQHVADAGTGAVALALDPCPRSEASTGTVSWRILLHLHPACVSPVR